MSHRFRVAFRENFCVDNPIICCLRWWRDRRNFGVSSSGSSSHRTPRVEYRAPQQPAVVQASLMTNLRDKIQPVDMCPFHGLSLSEEKRRERAVMCRPHFSSDPNFSLRVPVMCVDFTSCGSSNYELAREYKALDGESNKGFIHDKCSTMFDIKPTFEMCNHFEDKHHSEPEREYASTVNDESKV